MKEIDLEPLKEYLAMAIAYVIDRKQEQRMSPAHAGMNEITNLLNGNIQTALNDMVRSGLLSFHRTVNGVSFEFTPPRQTVLKR